MSDLRNFTKLELAIRASLTPFAVRTLIRYIMLNVPNAITLTRLVLVPVMAYFLTAGVYGVALIIFLVAAVSDLIDGFIARTFKLSSTLGATLDPIADKLNMLVATVLLAWQELIPIWLAIAIVTRDIVIVAGALAYRLALGHVEMAPTTLSIEHVHRVHGATIRDGNRGRSDRQRRVASNRFSARVRDGSRVRSAVCMGMGSQGSARKTPHEVTSDSGRWGRCLAYVLCG